MLTIVNIQIEISKAGFIPNPVRNVPAIMIITLSGRSAKPVSQLRPNPSARAFV